MLNNDFEKFVKENLESAKTSWDKEAMWADIEKALPEEKKKRWPLFLLMGLIACLVAGSVTLNNNQSNLNLLEQEELITQDHIPQASQRINLNEDHVQSSSAEPNVIKNSKVTGDVKKSTKATTPRNGVSTKENNSLNNNEIAQDAESTSIKECPIIWHDVGIEQDGAM